MALSTHASGPSGMEAWDLCLQLGLLMDQVKALVQEPSHCRELGGDSQFADPIGSTQMYWLG